VPYPARSGPRGPCARGILVEPQVPNPELSPVPVDEDVIALEVAVDDGGVVAVQVRRPRRIWRAQCLTAGSSTFGYLWLYLLSHEGREESRSLSVSLLSEGKSRRGAPTIIQRCCQHCQRLLQKAACTP